MVAERSRAFFLCGCRIYYVLGVMAFVRVQQRLHLLDKFAFLDSARLADKGGYRRTRTRRDIWTRGLKLFALLPIELRGHVVYSAIHNIMMHSRKSYRESERFVCRTRCRSVSGNRANNI